MDLIADVAKREAAELQARLSGYDTTVMIIAHNGDLPEVDGFTVVRVLLVTDLGLVKSGTIIAIDDESVQIAQIINRYTDVLGFNAVTLEDVPGQTTAYQVEAELGQLHKVSYLRILNDIADKRLVEENMTADELEASVAKRQDSLLRTKSGVIRPLIDFDRGYGDKDDSEEGIVPDDNSK